MRAWISAARALPMTFAIYLLEAAIAVLVGLPIATELAGRAPHGGDATALAQWLERGLQFAAPARVSAQGGALASAAVLLLAPWLQMAWFSALSRREPFVESLANGFRLWLRAGLVSLCVLLATGLALAPFAAAAWGVSRVLLDQLNDRVHDLTIACAALPLLFVACFAHVWHDLARARALHEGAFRSTRRSLRFAIKPTIVLRALFWTGLGWSLLWAAQLVPTVRLAGPAGLVCALQISVMSRLFLRSRWLADALTCAEDDAGSRAFEAS
jgi:hypothetical protein